MNRIEKAKTRDQEIRALNETDIKVILRNIVAAMFRFKNSPDQRASDYWKAALNHWIETARQVTQDKEPEYLKVEALERAHKEFVERIEALRVIDEDGIDIVVDDILVRFNVIRETTAVNDLTAVKNRIVERIREVNKEILLLSEPVAIQNKKNILNELIDLNALIPK